MTRLGPSKAVTHASCDAPDPATVRVVGPRRSRGFVWSRFGGPRRATTAAVSAMGQASPQGQRPARPVFPPAPTPTQRLGAVFDHPFDQSHLPLGSSAMTRRASAHQRSSERGPRCASTCAYPRKALLATAVVVELASACAWRLCSPRSCVLLENHMQRPHGV